MSKIADITTLLNLNFESTTLSSKRFQRGSFNGLAELVVRDGGTVPLILDNEGEGTEVELNDTYPFQVYHRILKISPTTDTEDQVGDGLQRKETTTLKMVVFANRRVMQFETDDLITAINVGFLTHLSNAQTATLGNWFSNIDIEVTDIEIDKEVVWRDEFGQSSTLPPFYQCFAFTYNVISDINTECFDLC